MLRPVIVDFKAGSGLLLEDEEPCKSESFPKEEYLSEGLSGEDRGEVDNLSPCKGECISPFLASLQEEFNSTSVSSVSSSSNPAASSSVEPSTSVFVKRYQDLPVLQRPISPQPAVTNADSTTSKHRSTGDCYPLQTTSGSVRGPQKQFAPRGHHSRASQLHGTHKGAAHPLVTPKPSHAQKNSISHRLQQQQSDSSISLLPSFDTSFVPLPNVTGPDVGGPPGSTIVTFRQPDHHRHQTHPLVFLPPPPPTSAAQEQSLSSAALSSAGCFGRRPEEFNQASQICIGGELITCWRGPTIFSFSSHNDNIFFCVIFLVTVKIHIEMHLFVNLLNFIWMI